MTKTTMRREIVKRCALQPQPPTKEMKVDIAVALVHWATTTTRIYLFSEGGGVMMTTKTVVVVVVHWSEVKSTTKKMQPISKCKRRSTEVCAFVCKSSSPQSQTVTSCLEHDDDHQQKVCVPVSTSADVVLSWRSAAAANKPIISSAVAGERKALTLTYF